jgi:hypothetical protein
MLICTVFIAMAGFAAGVATKNAWTNVALTLSLFVIMFIGDAIVTALTQAQNKEKQ